MPPPQAFKRKTWETPGAKRVSGSASNGGGHDGHRHETDNSLSISFILREAFEWFKPELTAVTLRNDQDGSLRLNYFHSAVGIAPTAAMLNCAVRIGEQAAIGNTLKGRISERDSPPAVGDSVTSKAQQPFYVAMPIKLEDGEVVGAFCVLTVRRMRWSKERLRSLELFVRACSSCLETQRLRTKVQQLLKREAALSTDKDVTEKKFNDLARNIPGAIFEYTMRPALPDTIEFMSPGCFDIWGYTPEELEGDPTRLWDAILEEDLPDMRASVLRSAEELTRWQHRWRIRTKSGVVKWLQSYGSPVRLSDGGTRWNTLILDVSIEQTAQFALMENTRLIHEAQKTHSIGRVAGGVAHDFNNILAVINGNAESISTSSLSDDDRESIEEIISASIRGAQLSKQLLGFARRSDLAPKSLNIGSVISAMSSMLTRVLPANISMETSLTAGMWASNVDRNMFENALLNLVINARDAMPGGGALTVETANVRIDKDYIETRDEDIPPGRYVMVAVTDTGIGIEESLLPRLFEPFFTTKPPNEGTGLGLAMVDGFVRQSGGAVRVYSEVGHGTSVKLYFPATPGGTEASVQREHKVSRLPSNGVRILLVEDQDAVRRIIEKTLRSAGHSVTSASVGDKAWEIFEQDPDGFDIIVTDVVMPGKLQGPQLVRAIRTVRRDIPTLFMSGYPHEANVHGNGVRDTDISLLKPVRRGELLTAIDRLARLI
jgi:PAS domain S-box-containing protein